MNKNTFRNVATVCRWTGRILGVALVFVIVLIAAGQGIPNPFSQPVAVQFGFLALALIVTGILAGWRWELSGGMTSLFGWCLFVAAVIPSPGTLNGFVIALALPGGLYLTSALLSRNHRKHLARVSHSGIG